MNETNHPARRLRHGDRPTEPLTFEDAAANKAAEEGGLPFAELSINQKRALSEGLSALEAMADIWSAEIRLSEMAKRIADAPAEQRPGTIAAMIEQAFIEGAYRHFLDHKDAADRASRQVANKAEVEPVAEWVNYEQGFQYLVKAPLPDGTKLYATPPVTTGASTAPHEIAKALGLYEPVSMLCAVKAIESLRMPVGASTLLTDEQVSQILDLARLNTDSHCESLPNEPSKEYSDAYFFRQIQRWVAAQAGQVAVPEDLARDAARWRFMMRVADDADGAEAEAMQLFARAADDEDGRPESVQMAEIVDRAIAAPSPAKESK